MALTNNNSRKFIEDADISSFAFWQRNFVERDETFGLLRRNAPVSWHPHLETTIPPEVHGEVGFWAVVKAADIRFVSQNHELFSSAEHGVMLRPMDPRQAMDPTFLEMDPPDHTKYRKLMSAAFTPKSVARLQDKIGERAHQIVSAVVGAGEIDFVTSVAETLPMLTVADMLGVPDELVETFASAGRNLVDIRAMCPPDVPANTYFAQQVDILRQIGLDLVKHRHMHPADDLATALAGAKYDAQFMSDDEITSVMMLLSVAGNDTTKQTTTSTVLALDRNPGEKAWLLADLEGRIVKSVDEFIRHASPVIQFSRTATRNVELGGQSISAGDKVAIFYCSGNRDEDAFEEPEKFILDRRPMPHLGFGGGGVHFCLGNGIAKVQLRAMFSEIYTLLPRLEVVAEPEYLCSEEFHGINHLLVNTH